VNIVSILTDFGLKDPYVAIMKGVMLAINPKLTLVDVTHEIEPQNVREGAFLIPEYCRFFSPGTVHLCVIDPTVGSSRKPLVVVKDDHLFVGPDNGLFSFLLDGATAYEISNETFRLNAVSNTFHGRDIFAPAAAYLSMGTQPKLFGRTVNDPVRLNALIPVIEDEVMTGEIVRFDRFGNAISNISSAAFQRFIAGGPFSIGLKGLSFHDISKSYFEGTMVCTVGSSGCLEFAIFKGNLRRDKRITRGDRIEVRRRAD
jgi:S-adenosyl-L-methionine hydrolase (adenosine-forming)